MPDEVHDEVLHVPLPLPSAWNVVPIAECDARGVDLTAPLPQSMCEVHLPGSMLVRRETGKRGAAVLIWHEGELVGVLEPAHIARILTFWAEHGVTPEERST
jgi:hypothetical protein